MECIDEKESVMGEKFEDNHVNDLSVTYIEWIYKTHYDLMSEKERNIFRKYIIEKRKTVKLPSNLKNIQNELEKNNIKLSERKI